VEINGLQGLITMKAVKNFLDFIEIGTKTASIIPFLAGSGYAFYRYGSIKPQQTLIFFLAMLLFDMTTTAINNHIGHRQTGRYPHYSKTVSLTIIFAMGLGAAAFGIYLVSISSIIILFVGILCFATGISYSYGFLPIARTPFGELISSVVMGVCIPFIAVEISHPMINIAFYDFSRIVITADWVELLAFGGLVIPLIFCLAPIMLANNICDIEEDARIQRYTLPVCIGIKKSLQLYCFLYIITYLSIIVAVVFRIVPVFTLVLLGTCIPVRKNVLRFMERQLRGQTFFTVILNFLMITLPYAACIWLGGFLL
jgi:1,4-dihydroxy-2-naphthoate octaprenyltransferase